MVFLFFVSLNAYVQNMAFFIGLIVEQVRDGSTWKWKVMLLMLEHGNHFHVRSDTFSIHSDMRGCTAVHT